ncbi:murein L,D-transpeptidase family protein [uncultured Cohaesibacter sp.]|uniref:murein L,D-transpeptidase family protein n=1 Tax=uncultured Cohaesibacter sp. TaxID=1002546 RepID=UPI00292F61B4|nr:murein L,D-transpeptidase family protein [uncultured Cohaesibacter sp.]
MSQGFFVRFISDKKTNRRAALLAALVGCSLLSACNPELMEDGKATQPIPHKLKDAIHKIGSSESAPLYIRIFKKEAVLEAWKQRKDGTYALLKTYPICAYSGTYGPKKKEGDRQAPEGFYSITPGQMNPNSNYYLSFNIGYPNKFDRAYGRTGAHLMVHGSCSSRGCYAMDDAQIAEIYALGREAFAGGQRSFSVHAFPFRMTPENMAEVRNNEHFPFWQNLKNGYDHFQITHVPPQVEVCDRTYVFDPQGNGRFNATSPCPDYTIDPSLLSALQKLRTKENVQFQQAVEKLQAKQQEQELKTNNKMIEAQLDLLKRKERVAEGKDPDGFLAGLIKSNKPTETVTSSVQTEPSESTPEASQPTEKAGFFSRLTSSFSKKKILLPQSASNESASASTLTTLPKPRQ